MVLVGIHFDCRMEVARKQRLVDMKDSSVHLRLESREKRVSEKNHENDTI